MVTTLPYDPGVSQVSSLEALDASTDPADNQAPVFPSLRSDVELLRGEFDISGAPVWTLHDPVKGKFYRIGWLQFELLSRWGENSAETIVSRIYRETTLTVSVDDVTALTAFLTDAELVEINDYTGIEKLQQNQARRRKSFLSQAFSFTMYHRVPLVNPDQFMTLLVRLCDPIFRFSNFFVWTFLILGSMALFGVTAHWYEFKDTFMLTMNPAGFTGYLVTLALINIVHECGHGVVAKHYGCRVPVMGLALIFMLPVCYSDVSDAWRLRSRRQRLLIDSGGLLVEITLAILAVLTWLALPEGILKMLAFFVAVTSLATTLFINLNPFMKFDGYFLLSDSVGAENLQTRSFANFKWELRKWITGVVEPMPYPVVKKTLKLHRTYAFSTCIYRIFLYLGIAYMVYTFWFKALGLLLVAGVIVSMVIRPVFKEVLEYMKIVNRQGITGRTVVSLSLLTLVVVLLLVPLPRKVTAPALLTAQEASRIYAPSVADISEVHVVEGQLVDKGDHLITLSNPSLVYENEMLLEQIGMLERRLASEADWTGSSTLQEIQKENIESKRAELNQLQSKIRDLVLKSPVNGEVVMVEDWVRAGSSVAENMILAEVATTSKPVIRAYVTALDKQHVDFDTAVFINESDSKSFDVKVSSVSNHAIASLEDEVLAIPNGGPIAVFTVQVDEVKPKNDLYLAVLDPIETQNMIHHEQSGVVMFPAKARSLASSTMQRIYGVVIRESGF